MKLARSARPGPSDLQVPQECDEDRVEPLHDAREHVGAEARLVPVDSDRPDACALRGSQSAEAACTCDVEHGSCSSRDLAARDRLAPVRVAEVTGVARENGDAGRASLRTRTKPDDEVVDLI